MLNFTLALIASEGGGGTLLDVNPGLIVWTVITFIILLFILKKTAWKPILTALDQRENAIKDALEKADRAKEDAQKVLDQNQASLAQAEIESKKIIDNARIYAEKLKEQMLFEAKEQGKKMAKEAADEIENRKTAAFNELKTQVSAIAIQAAEKIIKENINKDNNSKLVDNYINGITKN